MPAYDSPFGPRPALNLPQPKGLPPPLQVQNRPMMSPFPDALPKPPPLLDAPPKSEFESIVGGLGGLLKQDRDIEAKTKATANAKTLLEQLTALQNQRGNGPMNSDGSVQNSYRPGGNESTGMGSYGQKERLDSGRSYGPADVEDYMARNAKFESGADENAVNSGSGATGLFQFLPSTWRWIAKEAPELGLTDEGMKTRSQQMKAMRYYTNKSQNILQPILGRKPTGGELYLLHLLGHSGPAVSSNLDAPITKTISEGAYRGNPFLRQYTTGRDLIAGLNQQFGGSPA